MEDIIRHSKEKDAEMATMKFEVKRIQFYPEDLAKMETMSHKEKLDYAKKLKQQHRYIELD